MSAKNWPYIQFFPSDWRSDHKVQTLTFFERGVWFELLMVMYDCEERGKLVKKGRPMDDTELAKLLHMPVGVLRRSLQKIVDAGVAYIDENGIIYNKRMVEDEAKRIKNKTNGMKGGNPLLVNQGVNPRHKPGPRTALTAGGHIPDTEANAEAVRRFKKKTVDNNGWLTHTAEAELLPLPVVHFFCSQWLTTATLRYRFEDTAVNSLISYMLIDLRKHKPDLLKQFPPADTPGDFW